MSDLNQLLFDAFPEAAVLAVQGRIVDANPMARHYLPQLEPGAPVPSYLPLSQDAPESGTFTAGLSTYSFSLVNTSEGQLVLFCPAPQTALTDAQLDGVLRQMRTILAEFLVEAEGQTAGERPAFLKNFHRMFRLVDNLDFMRLAGSAQGLPFRPVTMDLAGLCRRVTGEAATLLRDAGVTLDFQSALPSLLIPGDAQLLQRLLLELISNSARAVGKGSIAVRLRSQGNRAILSLSDSGEPPTQRQLAAMLQQDSDQYLPAPGAGAGLGLSIARHIAALHGGSLLVDLSQSAPTMILSLPTGPLDPRVTVNTPAPQRDGGLSPLLVALSDVLPAGLFGLDLD